MDDPSALDKRSLTEAAESIETPRPTVSSTEESATLGTPPPTGMWVQGLPADVSKDLPEVPGHELLAYVARGGMGFVLKARHCVLGRTVAIKMPLHLDDVADRERFLREAKATARLRHANICPIYEVGEAGGRPYIAMAFIEGESLAQQIKRHLPTPRDAAGMVALLARAVGYAHQQGVLHRDIKPGNVMVDATTGQPMLMDFGLAKQLAYQEGELTQTGQVVGTPAYMAPEQASGHVHQVGPHSDVYALGAVLYHLLCGQPPFSGTTGEILRQVQTDEPAPPRKVSPRLHRDLETICLKTMAKEPSARYSTAVALAEDLERFCAGESILARRQSLAGRIGRRIRRRPIAAAMVLVATIALAVTGYSAYRNWEIARLERAIRTAAETDRWTQPHLDEVDAACNALGRLAPARADESRLLVCARFAGSIEQAIRQPRLEPGDRTRIEDDLRLLASRDFGRAVELREALGKRLADWQSLFDLATPFAGWEEVFPGSQVRAEGNGLVSLGREVLTRVPCRGNVRLEVELAEGWESGRQIDLLLAADSRPGQTDRGYVFMLDAVVPPAARDSKTGEQGVKAKDAPKPELVTFASAGRAGGALRAGILRNDVPLRNCRLPVPSGPLRLVASRDADRLSLQINDLPPIEFLHGFPAADHDAQVFGLAWPAGARLVHVRAVARRLPPGASRLERADDFYARRQFFDALAEYQQQAVASEGTEFAREARVKQALCLLALKRTREAVELLRPIAAELGAGQPSGEDQRWPLVAACHLWTVQLGEDQIAEAYATFESLSLRHTPEEIERIVPVGIVDLIVGRYRERVAGLNWFLYDPNRVQHLTRSLAVQQFFNAVEWPGEWSGRDLTRLHLCRTYMMMGEYPKARRVAEELLRERPLPDRNAAFRWLQLVEMHAWLWRLEGKPDRALAELDARLFEPSSHSYRPDCVPLLVERARIHAALRQWEEAEKDLAELTRLAPPGGLSYDQYGAACLLRGFLRQRRGDAAGALAAWREGSPGGRRQYDWRDVRQIEGVMHALLLAALTGELKEEHLDLVLAKAASRVGFRTDPAMVKSFLSIFFLDLTAAKMVSMATRLAARPRGREAVRQIAFREQTPTAMLRVALAAGAVEAADTLLADGQITPDQEAVAVRLAEDGCDAYYSGRFSKSHAMKVALTWQGLNNSMGWAGVASSLDPKLRGPMAYAFGFRYLQLSRRDDAVKFFQTARDDAPADSAIRRLAEIELNRLNAPPKSIP